MLLLRSLNFRVITCDSSSSVVVFSFCVCVVCASGFSFGFSFGLGFGLGCRLGHSLFLGGLLFGRLFLAGSSGFGFGCFSVLVRICGAGRRIVRRLGDSFLLDRKSVV